jgi:hypothetical protein
VIALAAIDSRQQPENLMSIRSDWNHSVTALLFALAAAAAPVAAQSDWAPGARMSVARDGHTATLLPDGKILVAGGSGGQAGSSARMHVSAELYDPAAGTWRMTAPLRMPRADHTAILLADGRVLVVGGNDRRGTAVIASELYDPATETWTGSGDADAGFSPTATLLRDGRVLVAGGDEGKDNFTYEPATGKWSTAAKLNVPRGFHTATRLRDGSVLVVGGGILVFYGESIEPVRVAEVYDPAADRWTVVGEPPVDPFGHSATLLPGGTVLIAGGGSDPQLFDPAARTWAATGPYASMRWPSATLLPNGNVLLAGGHQQGTGFQVHSSSVVQLFDPGTATWRNTSSLQTARTGHTATMLRDGRVLAAGGSALTERKVLDSTELYAAEPSPPGSIGPGFTGGWFDPSQSGHGIFTQVLPDNRFLAAWLAFDASGAQAWFTGIGTYAANTATIAAVVQPSGGRWIPNFDSARVVNNAWGSLTFTFTDCNHGRVDFSSSVAGFGSGSMELTRLTLPLGLTCPGSR